MGAIGEVFLMMDSPITVNRKWRESNVRRVLIFRIGSLGDTVVALPSFHLVAKAFPEAERRVLTHYQTVSRASPISAVLDVSGLVDGYYCYPPGLGQLSQYVDLWRQLRAWNPDLLVYLSPARSYFQVFRDLLFFWACGISRIVGLPLQLSRRRHRYCSTIDQYESEASRLVRCLNALGQVNLTCRQPWDLRISPDEVRTATQELPAKMLRNPIIACSVGSKWQAKDWGLDNWRAFVGKLGAVYPGHGVVFLGSIEEAARSDEVGSVWPGDTANMCGILTPRQSAALLRRAVAFVGHDSGPMHLAASVGTPCVAIFSARSRPGIWFPFGTDHEVLYHQTSCAGCELIECVIENKRCIRGITPDEVMRATTRVIERKRTATGS